LAVAPLALSPKVFGAGLLLSVALALPTAAARTLTIDSTPTEPASPLNLSLRVSTLPSTDMIEIGVVVGKRDGYPAEMFSATDMTVEIAIPPGFQLESGSLGWSGDIAGDEVVAFDATVRAIRDMDGIVEVAAVGNGPGGSVNADKEAFQVSVRDRRIEVSRNGL
jgi:hypothetical protein